MSSKLWGELRANWRLLAWVYVPCVGLLAALGVAALTTDIDLSKLTRDPAAITASHPFTGAVSNLGILLWAATAAVSFFTAAIVRARGEGSEEAKFFLLGGTLTVVLMLDDLFLLHERIYPSHLGLDERIVFAGYGLLLLFFVVWFRRRILKSDVVFLLAACGFFALSLGVDEVPEGVIRGHHLFEDGFKLLGIASWFGYFMQTSFAANLRERKRS